jgi:hypothetical protein
MRNSQLLQAKHRVKAFLPRKVAAMEFDIRWEEDTEDGPRVFRKGVTERVELSGTAKISFAGGGNEISEVSLLSFDQKTFALSEGPYGSW